MSEDKKVDSKKSLRDFAIGTAAGAGSAIAGFPFDKITDPVSSKNFRKAMQHEIEAGEHIPKNRQHLVTTVGGKTIVHRNYGQFVADQIKTTFWKNPYSGKYFLKEWSPLPAKMLKSGITLGTGTLIAGGLYRALNDKQPTEKQSNYISPSTHYVAQLFLSCKFKNS